MDVWTSNETLEIKDGMSIDVQVVRLQGYLCERFDVNGTQGHWANWWEWKI